MRAVQQSMTMAMAVNMASSSTGFVSPVGGGPPISSQNAASQYVPASHSSRYPPSQPTNSSSNGSAANNIRHSRKRRANSNAIEGLVFILYILFDNEILIYIYGLHIMFFVIL